MVVPALFRSAPRSHPPATAAPAPSRSAPLSHPPATAVPAPSRSAPRSHPPATVVPALSRSAPRSRPPAMVVPALFKSAQRQHPLRSRHRARSKRRFFRSCRLPARLRRRNPPRRRRLRCSGRLPRRLHFQRLRPHLHPPSRVPSSCSLPRRQARLRSLNRRRRPVLRPLLPRKIMRLA